MIGETIGSFRIAARLGAGGMGEVFLAEQATIDTKVAIKLLRPDISKDKDHVQRFFNEARAVGKIKHAGTVKIFEGGFHTSGHAYLIMEFLDGETLTSRIRRSGRLALGTIGDFGRQIASILGATQAVGITHRDLKPDNIFLVSDAELASGERVKILDFGIAKLTGTLASGPRTVGTMGTPSYMAPEQWGDSGSVDWRADAYSLGCVLFEMACGRPPFTGETFADLCAVHLTAPPPLPSSLVRELPPEFDALVLRLLAKKPADRAPSMADVACQLEAIGSGAPRALDPTVLPGTTSPALAAVEPRPSVAVAVGGVVAETLPPALTPAQTTLGHAAGEVTRPAPRRRGAIAVGSVAVAAVAAYAIRRGDDRPTTTHVRPVDVAPGEPPSRERILALDPFVSVRGVTLQRHQVTNAEAHLLGDEDARPFSWGDDARPVAFISFERARAFCRALGADLPTREQWLQAAGGAWGIDDGTGELGPLQEWTSTVDDGLAEVRGGHRGMTPRQLDAAIHEPLLKATEATAGAGAKHTAIAGGTIGFRCAR
jgi:serine/threonine-protein kinase